MITPADIEFKEFTRAVRGYKEEEVDAFLDLIIVDMEKLIKENKKLKEELEKAKGQVDKHISTETSVYETLEAAKSLMNDIGASAERRAEILLKNAELEASLITKEARDSIEKLTEEGARLKSRVETLRNRYKRMLEDELERMNYGNGNLLEEFEKEFLPASMTSAPVHSGFTAPASTPSKATVVMDPVKVEEKSELKKEDLTKTIVNIKY